MIHKRPLWISFLLTMLFVPSLHGAAEEFPSIGQLETREYLIVIHSSPAGILYTLKTHEGEIIYFNNREFFSGDDMSERLGAIVSAHTRRPQSAG